MGRLENRIKVSHHSKGAGGGRLGPNYMPGCVRPKVKDIGPFSASNE